MANLKLPTLENGKFVWQDDETTSVGNVGTHIFKVTFIPNDTTNYQTITDIEATIEVGKAKPNYTVPTNLTATYLDKLSDIALPTGFTWNEPDTSVGSVGEKSFLVTYTPEDTTNYAIVTNIEVNVTVNKKIADKIITPVLDEITYNASQKLSDITLPEGWTWDNPNTIPTVENKGYTATYQPQDTKNYDYSNENLTQTLSLIVNKANPTYTIPTNLTATWQDKLSDIKLPEGFSWQDNIKVEEIGKHTFKVTYTPNDTNNYNIIKDIEVTLNVTKASLTVKVPEDITINKKEGMKLSEIELPTGWNWLNPNQILTKSGTYQIIYTPEDTEHYESIVTNIQITIQEENNSILKEIPKTGDSIIKTFLVLSTSIVGLFVAIFKIKKTIPKKI